MESSGENWFGNTIVQPNSSHVQKHCMPKTKLYSQGQHSNMGKLAGEPEGKIEHVTQKLEQSGFKEKYYHPLT